MFCIVIFNFFHAFVVLSKSRTFKSYFVVKNVLNIFYKAKDWRFNIIRSYINYSFRDLKIFEVPVRVFFERV